MRTALVLFAVVLLPLGCRPSPPTTAAVAANVRSPTQTIEQLIDLRRGRQYERMHPLIIATQRYEVVNYLRAMDAYLIANEQLCVFVRDHIAIGLSQTIDQSGMAGNLNIFSQYVTLLDETIDGDTATLSFLVDEKLPARRADQDELLRAEKVALLAGWKFAKKYMQPCHYVRIPEEGKINCGSCEKCVRTMMTLIGLGKLDQVSAFFENDLSADKLFRMPLSNRRKADMLLQAIPGLRQAGRRDLVWAIRARVALFQVLRT